MIHGLSFIEMVRQNNPQKGGTREQLFCESIRPKHQVQLLLFRPRHSSGLYPASVSYFGCRSFTPCSRFQLPVQRNYAASDCTMPSLRFSTDGIIPLKNPGHSGGFTITMPVSSTGSEEIPSSSTTKPAISFERKRPSTTPNRWGLKSLFCICRQPYGLESNAMTEC